MRDTAITRDTRRGALLCTFLAVASGFWCIAGLVRAEDRPPSGASEGSIRDNGTRDTKAAGGKRNGGRDGKAGQGQRGSPRPYPLPQHSWDVATIILGCPTDRQISMSISPASDLEGYIEYGLDGASFTGKSGEEKYAGRVPVTKTLKGLTGDTSYAYRFRYRKSGGTEFLAGPVFHFHTQRAPGSPFTFEIQGDSHPERSPKQNDPVLYEQTLLAVAKDRPDFYICMGDDFSVDALPEVNAGTVASVYLKQMPYLGLVAHSSALFLVNGNHEQAALCNLNGTADNVAVWAQVNRRRFYPQPGPDGFYTGDTEKVEHIGLLRDYYAWTWGDALFVVIDPYWHSKTPVDNVFGGGKKQRDLWEVTLGDAQYKWLKTTLEGSRVRFKFVFTHHVLGTGRGGIEQAGLFEWGGRNRQGDDEFRQKRPGWELPIHQLMVRNGVTIFFQGHDHIFARQQKDGVVYQTLPDPADSGYTLNNREAYRSGDIFPGSGRVRVAVSAEKVRVEYVRSVLPKDATSGHPDGEIVFAYDVPSKR